MSKGGSAARWTPPVVTRATVAWRSGTLSGVHGMPYDSTKLRRLAHASLSHGMRLKSWTARRLAASLSMLRSEFSAGALFGGEILQARRPPPGPNRLRELRGQPFPLDLARQRLVVVAHGHEL